MMTMVCVCIRLSPVYFKADYVFSAFIGVKFSFIYQISENYTDVRCLLYIKVLTQQANGGKCPSFLLLWEKGVCVHACMP